MATPRPALLAEPPSLKVARWFCIAVLAANAPVACWSGYRAIWQVRDLAILAPSAPLRATALGRSQFLRTPPPTIRVANVVLAPD